MKYILSFIVMISLLYANEENTSELVEIKDTSGLSDNAIREKIEKSDSDEKKSVSLKDIYEVTDKNGSVNMKELEVLWENQTPKTNGYDWVRTKSGEWFKGEIQGMYDDSLEFDSDEIGLYTFDFEDVTYIKSYSTLIVNIEKVASIRGIVRYDGYKIKIVQGNTDYEFHRSQIVSFAPSGELERNYWSGKVSLSLDQRSGNKNQFDFTSQINLKRLTDMTRFRFDYLGRVSSLEKIDIANDHRITQTIDMYITKRFFWAPLFLEYYTDKFQNINYQVTASTGLGYTLIDTKDLTLDISGGPGVLYTEFETVKEGEEKRASSLSLETRVKLEWEINKENDLIYDYKFTFTDKESGLYKHHMILSLENELTSWLDVDLSFIWDRLEKPTQLEDGTLPLENDYQMLIGLGVEF